MTFFNPLVNKISTDNSTSTPLGISEVFTGEWEACDGYAEIRFSFDADEEGENCVVEFSPDGGSKVERTIIVPPVTNSLQTNFGGIHTLNPVLPFFRIIYTNGLNAQTDFTLTTLLAVRSGDGLTSRSTQILNKYNDVGLIRAISDSEVDRNLGLISYQNSVRAFGINAAVGNGIFETIWTGAENYVFPQAAETLQVAAGGNVNDTSSGTGARLVSITFLDVNFEEQTEVVTLAGVSVSTATTATAIRVLRSFVIESGTYGGSNTGMVTVENTSSNNPLSVIPAGLGRSQDAVYTIPVNKTAYVTKIRVSVGQADSADLRLVAVPNVDDVSVPFTSVSNVEWSLEDFSGATQFEQDTFLKFFEKTDLYFEGIRITGSGTARVSVGFEMILVDN